MALTQPLQEDSKSNVKSSPKDTSRENSGLDESNTLENNAVIDEPAIHDVSKEEFTSKTKEIVLSDEEDGNDVVSYSSDIASSNAANLKADEQVEEDAKTSNVCPSEHVVESNEKSVSKDDAEGEDNKLWWSNRNASTNEIDCNDPQDKKCSLMVDSWRPAFPPADELTVDQGAVRLHEDENTTNHLSATDVELCQRLDLEYDHSLESLNILLSAQYASIRQSAFYSIIFFLCFLLSGTLFYSRYEWEIKDCLLFSIYTITTVGYGNHVLPDEGLFHFFTILYTFVGIAALTIVVAQAYSWIALEAARAQYSLDKIEKNPTKEDSFTTEREESKRSYRHSIRYMMEYSDINEENQNMVERGLDWADSNYQTTKAFFKYTSMGRTLSVILPLFFLVILGATVVGAIEGWTCLEAIYWAVISLTTVGYGDFYPKKDASVWFCIFYLPFSIGFMSLFLSKIAQFYIKMNNLNIVRLERQMKRKLHQQKLEKTGNGRVQRSNKGISNAFSVKDGKGSASNFTIVDDIDEGNLAEQDPSLLPEGYDTLEAREKNDVGYSHSLFGSSDVVAERCKSDGRIRREKILIMSSPLRHGPVSKSLSTDGDNSHALGEIHSDSQHKVAPTMTSMKVVLDAINFQINQKKQNSSSSILYEHSSFIDFAQLDNILFSGVESTVRSSDPCDDASKSNIAAGANRMPRKASFPLRALVQERIAHIIANEIAGYQSGVIVKDVTLSVTMNVLRSVADKWMIPRKARKAFRSASFEALLFVGERALVTQGVDVLLALCPLEFHGLFAPFLAAMGDADTMEAWLENTNLLADVEFKKIILTEEERQFNDKRALSLRRKQTAANEIV